MHRLWTVQDVVEVIVGLLGTRSQASFIRVCRSFWEYAVRQLWEDIDMSRIVTLFPTIHQNPKTSGRMPCGRCISMGSGFFRYCCYRDDRLSPLNWERFSAYAPYISSLAVRDGCNNLVDLFRDLDEETPEGFSMPSLKSLTIWLGWPNQNLPKTVVPRFCVQPILQHFNIKLAARSNKYDIAYPSLLAHVREKGCSLSRIRVTIHPDRWGNWNNWLVPGPLMDEFLRLRQSQSHSIETIEMVDPSNQVVPPSVIAAAANLSTLRTASVWACGPEHITLPPNSFRNLTTLQIHGDSERITQIVDGCRSWENALAVRACHELQRLWIEMDGEQALTGRQLASLTDGLPNLFQLGLVGERGWRRDRTVPVPAAITLPDLQCLSRNCPSLSALFIPINGTDYPTSEAVLFPTPSLKSLGIPYTKLPDDRKRVPIRQATCSKPRDDCRIWIREGVYTDERQAPRTSGSR